MNAQQDLQQRAEKLSEVAERLGLTRLRHAIVDDTNRRLEGGTLRAVVVGEIKQGKSTLINALCKQKALPTGVTPTTGAAVVIRSGEDGRFWVERSGERIALEPERFDALAKGQGEAPSHDGWLERIVQSDAWPEGIELIDTPGVNDIAAFRSTLSRGELPRADILIVVLDGTQLLNRAEMAFLRDALVSVGGFGASGARLLAVINRMDLVAPEERPSLVEHLRREFAGLLAGASIEPEIFLTDARRAVTDPDAADETVQGVAQLRQRLQEIAAQRDDLLPARARAGLRRYALLLSHNAAIAAHALTLKLDVLKREIEDVERAHSEQAEDLQRVREQIAAARARILQESSERTSRFRQQLQQGLLASLMGINLRTMASHLPGAIHDSFLGFAREESERLRSELDELTRDAIHTHTEAVRRRLFHAALRLGFQGPPVYLDPPSAVLEAGLVVVGVAGTAVMYFGNFVAGALMAVAGPLTTVLLREKSLRDARERAKAVLPPALDRAEQALREQVRRVVDGHLEALDEHLLLASSALRDQLLAVLRHAKEQLDPADEASPTEAVNKRREEARKQLAQIEAELESLCKDLERPGSGASASAVGQPHGTVAAATG